MTPEQFYDKVKEFGIELTEEQKWQLHRYYELLVEWNEKMNLTGITEVNEVYLKHFYDSLLGFLMFEDIHNLNEEKNESISAEAIEQLEIQVKYEGYINKALQQVEKVQKVEEKKIPDHIDYDDVPNLAIEAKQKLKDIRPLTIGQASRISGVNPADISILMVYIESGRANKVSE